MKAVLTDYIQLRVVWASKKCGKDEVGGGGVYMNFHVQGLAFGAKSREMK